MLVRVGRLVRHNPIETPTTYEVLVFPGLCFFVVFGMVFFRFEVKNRFFLFNFGCSRVHNGELERAIDGERR